MRDPDIARAEESILRELGFMPEQLRIYGRLLTLKTQGHLFSKQETKFKSGYNSVLGEVLQLREPREIEVHYTFNPKYKTQGHQQTKKMLEEALEHTNIISPRGLVVYCENSFGLEFEREKVDVSFSFD